jgi:quercetin dioxygenase-like cupin family protein
MTSVSSAIERPVAGQVVDLLGCTLTFKAVSSTTGGAYSLVDCVAVPGAGTPPHIQHEDDEAFLVLDGTFEIVLGEAAAQYTAGDYVFVPRGTVHAFRNAGTAPARMLIVNSPGGLHERFFAECGVPAGSDAAAPGFEEILASAARYGIEILPPSE